MIKHNMFKKGVLIADKWGTYIIVDLEDKFIKIRDVLKDRKGNIVYGKERFIGTKDLDNYRVV